MDIQEETKPFLIINSDDLGFNEFRDKGMLEAYASNSISESTMIINGYNIKNCIEFTQKNNKSVGLHLNLTDGPPVYQENKENNPLLSKQKWYMDENSPQTEILGFNPLKVLIQKLEKKQIDLEFLKNEIRAQIQKFIDFNKCLPSHIDGHKHIQMIPQIAKLLAQIMSQEFKVFKVRITRNIFQKNQEKQMIIQKIYEQYGVQTTDYFFASAFCGKNNFDQFQKFTNTIKNLQKQKKEPLTIELMCHVGYPCKVAGAAFSKSENRQEELQFLSSKQFKDYIKSHYRLTNYQSILNKLE